MKKIILISLIVICHLSLKSQEISKVDFNLVNDKLYISFNLAGIQTNSNVLYDICVKIVKKNGLDVITPKTISGDVREVSTDGVKLIIWDIFKDVEFLEGEFSVEVSLCNKKELLISTPQVDFSSTRKTNTYARNKSNFKGFIPPIIFAGIGGAAKIFSNTQYDKYLAATSQSDMDNYYGQANTFNKVFVTMAGTAVIWTVIKLIAKKPNSSAFQQKIDFKLNAIALSF